MSALDKGLANPVTVAEMTAAYSSATRKVQEAYQLLDDAQKELTAAFGNEYGRFDTLPDRHSIYARDMVKDILERLKRGAWRAIIARLDIRRVLSIKRNEELSKRLEEGTLPEINDAEILGMVTTLTGNAPDFARELALEVFDFLRPAAKEPGYKSSTYVTNQKNGRFDLGKKIILTWMVGPGYGRTRFQVNYQKHDQLRALDRVFSLLDGEPMQENVSYQSPLIDAVNCSPDGTGQTKYFRFRACYNGNLHLEFTRPDLVTKLNQIAGNPTELKGKPYSRKTAAQPAMI